MTEAVRDLIDAIDAVTHGDAVKAALDTFTLKTGYQRFAYIEAAATEVRAFSNYSRKWQKVYLNGALSTIDPVIFEAKRTRAPFKWSADKWKSVSGAKEMREFRDQAIAFGIRSGLSVPIRGSYGRLLMLTLASSKPDVEAALPDDPVDFASAILAIHYRLIMIDEIPLVTAQKHLSPREATCIRWSSNGMKVPDIAAILQLEIGTVQRYLDSARAKLGATTIAHAVRIARDQRIL